MPELRTNESLLSALKKATSPSPSQSQVEKQRLSFVMGALPTDNNMTREQVQQILDQQRGATAAVE